MNQDVKASTHSKFPVNIDTTKVYDAIDHVLNYISTSEHE